jgi:hypothetical protein
MIVHHTVLCTPYIALLNYCHLLHICERLLYVDHVRYVWSRAICGLSVESVWRVGQVFPTECTSIRIFVTLGYE